MVASNRYPIFSNGCLSTVRLGSIVRSVVLSLVYAMSLGLALFGFQDDLYAQSVSPSPPRSTSTPPNATPRPPARLSASLPALRQRVVAAGLSTIGVWYTWGGQSSDQGFDCSGLTRFVYEKAAGIHIPRLARSQYAQGRSIKPSQLTPGDLVFFAIDHPRQVSHVGLYIGHNKFVHAPRTGTKVRVDTLKNLYWAGRFKGARRYLDAKSLSMASLKPALPLVLF